MRYQSRRYRDYERINRRAEAAFLICGFFLLGFLIGVAL